MYERTCCSTIEIARPAEIGNEPRLCWAPSQALLSLRAGGRAVDTNEVREPAKMVGRLLGGSGDDRHVQASADHAGDVPERHALVGDPVIFGSRGTLLQHESVEMGSIEPVHRGPAVEPVPHVRPNAFLTRAGYEGR